MATIASTCQLLFSHKTTVSRSFERRIASRTHQRCLVTAKVAKQKSSSVATAPASLEIAPDVATQRGVSSPVLLECVLVVYKKNVLDLVDVLADFRDDAADFLLGKKVTVQLVSEELLPGTQEPKMSDVVPISHWYCARDRIEASGCITYKVQIVVDKSFGNVGAVRIGNAHPNEFFLSTFHIVQPDGTSAYFTSDSWLHPTAENCPRIFFRNKVCLPGNTPLGLRNFRARELQDIQGDGTGERKDSDRVYDYDVYNDLGNPDNDIELRRPVLGGGEFAYPRRVRTGRPPTQTDPRSESLPPGIDNMYVPSDETFMREKNSNFVGDTIKAAAHYLVPAIKSAYRRDKSPYFQSFEQIIALYDDGIELGQDVSSTNANEKKKLRNPFTLINQLTDTDKTNNSLLKYPLPQIIQDDCESWMLDYEFGRQTIAGLNPMIIKKLESYPPVSSLDPKIFGPKATALKDEHILDQLNGLTVQEALEANKLFILDYHDAFLPYLNRINAQEGKKTYATRTILFLTDRGVLKPIAIELSLPAATATGQRKNRVFVCSDTPKRDWAWEVAKGHVAVNDCGYHQLISHWLRTHAVMEPFIIAMHRQLSILHPIYLLLIPHFKDTMTINSKARQSLINASGIIEANFTPGKYSIEISAVVYGSQWRFDQQGLPADLIARGMATPNPKARHGLDLLIEDYPYAVDGLNLWSALKQWVTDYTDIFYKDDASVRDDTELQAWWQEIVNVGHADKKVGWTDLNTKANLIEALTTMIWIPSCHHAAVNFGQYAYAGFPVNRPTIAHKLIPDEDTEEYKQLRRGEKFYLSSFSTKVEATQVMTTIEILSTHSSDEEYLGTRPEHWTSDKRVLDAFERFKAAIAETEAEVMAKNADPELKNRRGLVNLPYTLLAVSSSPGITGRGVPNSISI
ncbi:linoleate 9S-lipoxygenase [Selaginella moellendorffii]|nr:linoleate 9S-lipoxygenase [Selaginella moellendorffii]|eukprot:XP_024523783.1 linoleate 9S-lipoxygenase [Selaginella moellendorffii]